MSGGEQQMCAIGRALMARPKLLLLDEPSMGLAPIFVEKIFEIVIEINAQGTPVLLVEQNALMALDVAQRGYVMETGTDRARGRRRRAARRTSRSRRRTSAWTERASSGRPPTSQPGSTAAPSRTPIAAARRRRGRAPSRARRRRRGSGRTRAAARRPASRQPATSTRPSRSSAGRHASQSANGSSGWRRRPLR